MRVKILSQKYNPLLKRKEVVFEVNHTQEGQTASRLELRNGLASLLKTKVDLVLVEKVETKTGTTIAVGKANAYDTVEQARTIERGHIIARNIPPEGKPEGKPAPTSQEEEKEKKEGE